MGRKVNSQNEKSLAMPSVLDVAYSWDGFELDT
jgi:hypothetical protein